MFYENDLLQTKLVEKSTHVDPDDVEEGGHVLTQFP